MVALVVALLVRCIVGVVAQVDGVRAAVGIGTFQSVVCQVVVHVAILQQVVILLEAQGKGVGVVAGRRYALPGEVVVVRLVLVAVVVGYRVAVGILQRVAPSVGRTYRFAFVNVRVVRNAQMYTVKHKLEVGLSLVEACQVGTDGGLRLAVRRSPCAAISLVAAPCAGRAVDLYVVGVAHEVPLQIFRHRLHAVVRRAVFVVVVPARGVVLVVDELRAVPYLLLRPDGARLAVHLRLQVARALIHRAHRVEVGMVRRAVRREVHEVDVVVRVGHLLHLCLGGMLLQEDVARHHVAGIDSLCTGGRSTAKRTVAGVFVNHTAVIVVFARLFRGGVGTGLHRVGAARNVKGLFALV